VLFSEGLQFGCPVSVHVSRLSLRKHPKRGLNSNVLSIICVEDSDYEDHDYVMMLMAKIVVAIMKIMITFMT